jgi:hypothetical protein
MGKGFDVKQLSIDLRVPHNVNIDLDTNEFLNQKLYELFQLYNIGILGYDVHDVSEAYEQATCKEICPHCEKEVDIPSNKISSCPNCGGEIIPCSMCNGCNEECPFGYEHVQEVMEC